MEPQPLRRRSIFVETGLDDDDNRAVSSASRKRKRPSMSVRINSKPEVRIVERFEDEQPRPTIATGRRQRIDPTARPSPTVSPLPDFRKTIMQRLSIMTLLVSALVPLLQSTSLFAHSTPIQGVSGGVIPEDLAVRTVVDLSKRDNSPTDACTRWAQQCKSFRNATSNLC